MNEGETRERNGATQRRVLLSLVGGRPLPNVLAALHLKPDILYFVVSRDSVGEGGDFDKTVGALPSNPKPQWQVVDPYDMEQTITACQMFLADHLNDEVVINITLGPKTMALGAYEAARRWKESNPQIDLCYLAREGLVWVLRNSIEAVQIDLADYFRSYGWNVRWKEAPDDNENNENIAVKVKRLASLFSTDLDLTARLLKLLRSNDPGKGKRTIHAKPMLTDEFDLLREVEKIGFVSGVTQDSQRCSWTINSEEDRRALLGGDWLEYHCFHIASELGPSAFNECGWGVEDATGKGEIDFVGMSQGQMILASCKTETSLKRQWFEELHSKAEQLGKGMCSPLLVTTASKAARDNSAQADYDKWASERQIVLVMAEDIPRLPEILRKVVRGDPKIEPVDVACYPRI